MGLHRPAGRRRRAFTLIEMLTTVAVLVILLGLMVTLARDVRKRSSLALTKDLLRQLDAAMTKYAWRYERPVVSPASPFDPVLPPVAAFPPPGMTAGTGALPEATGPQPASQPPLDPSHRLGRDQLLPPAAVNNRDVMRALALERDLLPEGLLAGLPASVYDGQTLRDAWGSPIVFMSTKHPWVGTAPRDKAYFFFSAGPDRDYLTRYDNLYSYEEIAGTGR